MSGWIIPNYPGKEAEIPGFRPLPAFWSLMIWIPELSWSFGVACSLNLMMC